MNDSIPDLDLTPVDSELQTWAEVYGSWLHTSREILSVPADQCLSFFKGRCTFYVLPYLAKGSPKSWKTCTLRFKQANIKVLVGCDDLYVMGIQVGDTWYVMKGLVKKGHTTSLEGTVKEISVGENYNDLEIFCSRPSLALGYLPLQNAIYNIYHNFRGKVGTNEAKSLLVIIQMVSESIRFRYMEVVLLGLPFHGVTDPVEHAKIWILQNSWRDESKEVYSHYEMTGGRSNPSFIQWVEEEYQDVALIKAVKPFAQIQHIQG